MGFASALGGGIQFGSQIGGAYNMRDTITDAGQVQQTMAQRIAQLTGATTDQAAGGVSGAGANAGGAVDQATQDAMNSIFNGGMGAYGKVGISKDEANALLQSIYGKNMENLSPYSSAGSTALSQMNAGTAPGGDFNKTFTADDMTSQDPGYAFRIAEGQKALERSAAARGGALGGGTLKALNNYAQNTASDDFSKASDRFRATQQDRFGRLNTLAGIGQRATETGIAAGDSYGRQSSANTMNAGQYQGNMLYGMNRDAGAVGMQGATTAGQFRLSSMNDAARLRMQGLGMTSEAMAAEANAKANAMVGSQAALIKGWSNAGGALSSMGGFGGGGGNGNSTGNGGFFNPFAGMFGQKSYPNSSSGWDMYGGDN